MRQPEVIKLRSGRIEVEERLETQGSVSVPSLPESDLIIPIREGVYI